MSLKRLFIVAECSNLWLDSLTFSATTRGFCPRSRSLHVVGGFRVNRSAKRLIIYKPIVWHYPIFYCSNFFRARADRSSNYRASIGEIETNKPWVRVQSPRLFTQAEAISPKRPAVDLIRIRLARLRSPIVIIISNKMILHNAQCYI